MTETTAVAMPAVKSPLAIGEIVGGVYEVTALLGLGGMGAVYEAKDRVLRRTVAIKVPIEERGAQALRNEACALAALRHPSLVTVHAAGVHRGVDYVVMERLHGQTLERLIDATSRSGKTIPIAETLMLLTAIADGLSALHGAGMAHRDLKPANVILHGARVVLIDLGLFVPEFDVGTDRPIAGSPEYVAPEVLMRNVAPGAGPLVDLYALGILAFELLVGQSPFLDGDVAKIVARQLGARPPDVRTLRPDAPSKLAELVTELLAKDPSDRPQSSEAVLWRLGEIASRDLSRARPLRVDVVDDDPDVGAVLARSLEQALPGLVVRAFTDPRDAVAAIERDPPDVVAVDLNMPIMNGVETCMRIGMLALPQPPTIVAMSAEASDADVRVLRSLGASHFVPKDYRFVSAMSDVIGTVRRSRDLPPSSMRPPSHG